MDKSEELYQHARRRFDHETARRLLKEKYQARMIFAHAGGMWRAGPDLLILLSCCVDDELVLSDLYETPVKVNVKELLALAKQRWQEQMNGWLAEYEQNQQLR